jgi:hypothetical protein
MKHRSPLAAFTYIFSLLIVGLVVSGNDACDLQKDYEFGAQSKVATSSPTASASASVTASATPDDDDDDETPTPSPDPTPTGTPDPDATPTPTPSPDTTPGFFASVLSAAVAEEEESDAERAKEPLLGVTGRAAGRPSNWLGQAFAGVLPGTGVDSDQDGFFDGLEDAIGTDKADPQSYPAPTTFLKDRLKGNDDDGDGIPNVAEKSFGLNMLLADTDGDGVNDGAEKLSGTDPKDAGSLPIDSDHDGLSDTYESAIGTNPSAKDTDGDALPDDVEVALGTNPKITDSDGDGITDGAEVKLGSDPILPESGFSSQLP